MKLEHLNIGKMMVVMILLVFAGLMTSSAVWAQSRTHNLGDFRLRIDADDELNTNDKDPTGEWPQDHFRYSQIVWYNSGHAVGNWVDNEGTSHEKETWLNPVSYNQTAPYGIREYRRFEPPEVWVYSEGELQLSSRRFNGTVTQDIPSDIMILNKFKSMPGFDVEKRSYSYSNPNHDDYVIHRTRYLCTFDWDQDPEPDTDTNQILKDVYILVGYSFQTAEGTYITYSRWYEEAKDDWATLESYSSVLVENARDLQISYGWDGDHPELEEFESGGPDFDDTGDPRFAIGSGGTTALPSGEFVSSAYGGFAALHVDNSPSDYSDDVRQPVSVMGNMNIYNVWDLDFPGFGTPWDFAASGIKQTVEDQAGWPDDAMAQEAEYPFQAFGPYDFALGDSIVIYYAVGVNGISGEPAIEKGLEWRDWYRGVEGATFDNDQKNALLATGRDSLFQTMDRALFAFKNQLDIPDPLPSPDLTVRSGPNRVDLEWEDLSGAGDPDTDVHDLAGYRIYRKRGEFLVDTYNELNANGTHELWRLLAEVPSNQTTYSDDDVIRGEAYHYAVTAVDDGTQNTNGIFPGQRLESSRYANRSEIAAYPFEPGKGSADLVRIVPNPYVSGARDFNFTGDANKILFVNLPSYCTLRIFTITGDLIRTLEHTSGSADESWDQITDSNQQVASGVYLLHVDNAKDDAGTSIAGTIQKFVIVR